MRERTIIVGSASKELRLIGWRVGWVVAPESYIPNMPDLTAIMPDLTAVALANVVVPVGIAQDAAASALARSVETVPSYVSELERRRDMLVRGLDGLPVGVPAGGWSLLLRVSDFGIDGATMAERLFAEGVCATAMAGWGEWHGAQYIRFVFSNEPVERLAGVGDKVRSALRVG